MGIRLLKTLLFEAAGFKHDMNLQGLPLLARGASGLGWWLHHTLQHPAGKHLRQTSDTVMGLL
ncbi:hypothetical protein KSB_91820 [Ktedonobacter robiniae]|uniref:Uncharacterized protein n=1 Tax=Ktedonobacter robiniae TaxID=2778365 RepID=A0ABQ3V7F7_9CHLR|nr:hypothetical protein KSB_91820 [Ktedonobacter robiniae]